uniref:Ovule protein n=1 Tax=Heterorhabditis bacteriophora TaxID=37862 RepID=A0A1I7W6P6_HETBA
MNCILHYKIDYVKMKNVLSRFFEILPVSPMAGQLHMFQPIVSLVWNGGERGNVEQLRTVVKHTASTHIIFLPLLFIKSIIHISYRIE